MTLDERLRKHDLDREVMIARLDVLQQAQGVYFLR